MKHVAKLIVVSFYLLASTYTFAETTAGIESDIKQETATKEQTSKSTNDNQKIALKLKKKKKSKAKAATVIIVDQPNEVEDHSELPAPKERQIIGWVERIKIYPENLTFDAKMNPGSEGNVMHAEKIKTFLQGTEEWVTFETVDKFENIKKMKRKVINSRGFITTSGQKEVRYRVQIPVCIAGQYIELEFALANRNIFRQAVRIGGDSLAGHFIIDPARTKTTKPICKILEPESSSRQQ